ncbi:MAG TPA: lipocalin-like domain-containing protein [Bryobacteraceae bacterium]|jgi:predicted secreted hydrolase|nr:lipocalin-like domain-containing protein [Bryobacteraceae bacterium]
MIAKLGAILLSLWQLALPGYHYEFPRDHFSHPDYQTEWWYYTGNLHTADGRHFGFELTFFREGVDVNASSNDVWNPSQIYFAHLALSDIDGGRFYHTERLNRAGPGLAGASFAQQTYWNGNWQVHWTSLTTGQQDLRAIADQFTLELNLNPEKPFVINGEHGVSQKGPLPGEASHYISFTRLGAQGTLSYQGISYSVDGLAWMDHEFFTEQLGKELAGWDWFAIQLDNNQELMLYRLRLKSGAADPYSSGTYVDANGEAHHLTDFSLQPGRVWHSPATGARYPLSWTISVPVIGIYLEEHTRLNDQELASKNGFTPSYWEGAVEYSGTMEQKPVKGVGYLEMTGYDGRPLL